MAARTLRLPHVLALSALALATGCGSSMSGAMGRPPGDGGDAPSSGAGGTGGVAGTSGAGGGTGTGAGGAAGTGAGGVAGTGGAGGAAGATGAAGTAGTGAGGAAGTGGAVTGFGAGTPGGRGGAVIKVTTLAASGAGSLVAALATAGPRVIVFEVGGVIDMAMARVNVAQPFVTVAGETAPSPGITLIRGGAFAVTTHDVIIRHIRVRMGDAGAAPASGFEPDVTTDGPNAHDILFDHVSVAWGVDENLSVSGPRFDGIAGTSRAVTIRNSIIAEGLRNSIHSKGLHSMGTLIHDYCTDVAVIGNFYAHNNERNPWFKAFGTGVIVNNVVYDPGVWAMRLGAVVSEWTGSGMTPQPPRVAVVGNVMRQGLDTPPATPMLGTNSSGSAYASDNIALDVAGRPATIVGTGVTALSARPVWPDGLTARPAAQVVDWVMANAGARPKDRDAVDTRLVAGFRAGTGHMIDSQNDVGGYPTATLTRRTLTVPAAPGDVDAWLATFLAQVE